MLKCRYLEIRVMVSGCRKVDHSSKVALSGRGGEAVFAGNYSWEPRTVDLLYDRNLTKTKLHI